VRSLYIHIPFCRGTCDYCDFLSFPLDREEVLQRYLEALCVEMAFYSGEVFQTLYLGGGTPSILSAEQISMIDRCLHDSFNLDGLREFTLEVNPETVDPVVARRWTRAGVNRVSLGVQSFDEQVLSAHHRRARPCDVHRAFQIFRQCGVANLNVDLILGLQLCHAVPEERAAVRIFEEDLNRAVALSPEHISLYILSLPEESTSTAKEHPSFSEQTVENLYLHPVRFLADHGFPQYEISNFARPGFESVHNRQYWRGGEYRGLGLGSVSTLGNRRMRNVETLQDYLHLTESGRRPVGEMEVLDSPVLKFEKIMLALRQRDGMDSGELLGGMPQPRKSELLGYLTSLRKLGFCEPAERRLALTPKGYLRSNVIIADIIRLMANP
jgi:oxygen-independent coproporphyrinogen-3 oxidase